MLKTYRLNDSDTVRDGEESDSSSVTDMDVDSEDVDLIVVRKNVFMCLTGLQVIL